ncbi:DsbA family protein [Sporosarcina sp. ANT_H38]|uniref:DsbA family protein n=1 Tax=Sporosarcina sp. ANT_H38 TaxID=2597358 RepID=UPI0011F25ED3|nr:DsbA family protein [Sporosarcina sp. ANT_H38]KAA0966948.1 DsbA family protein [Sporosarcina sp. ANT_H38]
MKNNMMCDLETGICGPGGGGDTVMQFIDLSAPQKKVDLYYVTDPICSHCWALEPVLRRFEALYGHYFNAHTVMGGLLENWDGFADTTNGITSPADVAGHWREVGDHSRMPIDGGLWHDNPIESSFTPSRVFKVIHKQNPELANTFLRRAREALFAFNRNIAHDDLLIDLVNKVGLNGDDIVKQSKLPEADTSLQEDFQLVRQLGVRGFPTIVMLNEEKKGVKIVGARALEQYMAALQQMLPGENLQPKKQQNLQSLIQKEKLLFSREIEEFYAIEQKDVEVFVSEQMANTNYEMKEVLGERYITIIG